MLCCSKEVSLQRYYQQLYLDLGNTLIHWSCVAVPDCARVWVRFSLGASHNAGMEQPSVYFQVTHQISFALFGMVNLYPQCPVLVIPKLMLFLFLCQEHKLSIKMRHKCWLEECCPDTQVQPFLHIYKFLYHGVLLSSFLTCKALRGGS